MKKKIIFPLILSLIFLASCNKDDKNNDDTGCYADQKNSVLNNDPTNQTPTNNSQTVYYYECFYADYSGKATNGNLITTETFNIVEGTGTHIVITYGNTNLNCDIATNFDDITVVSGKYYADNTYYDIISGTGKRDGRKITLNFKFDGVLTPFNSLDVSLEMEKI